MAGGVTKQITWTYAREGCPTNARISLCNKKYLHCLFFCQQAIEKAVKAVYYDKYNKTPPRKHDLVALAKNAGIFSEMDETRKDLFVLLSQYYIESRYAEDRKELAKNCTRAVTEDIMKKTSEVLEWLKSKLK